MGKARKGGCIEDRDEGEQKTSPMGSKPSSTAHTSVRERRTAWEGGRNDLNGELGKGAASDYWTFQDLLIPRIGTRVSSQEGVPNPTPVPLPLAPAPSSLPLPPLNLNRTSHPHFPVSSPSHFLSPLSPSLSDFRKVRKIESP